MVNFIILVEQRFLNLRACDDYHGVVRGRIAYCVIVLVVNLQFWLVCRQRFLESRTRLTSKADFFQLIFWVRPIFLVEGKWFLERHSLQHGTWFEGGGPPSPPTPSNLPPIYRLFLFT